MGQWVESAPTARRPHPHQPAFFLTFLADSKLKSGAAKYGCSSSTVSSVMASRGKLTRADRNDVSPIMRTAAS